MRDALCRAFCDDLSVRAIEGGMAVSTPFDTTAGEPIGFYILRDPDGRFHIEDDGTTIPMLEANGVDFSTETRRQGLHDLLAECGAEFDTARRDLRTPPMSEGDIPAAARRFVSLLLRVQDANKPIQEKEERKRSLF